MVASIYIATASLKNGLWTRDTQPTIKSNLATSIIPALILGVFWTIRSMVILDKPISESSVQIVILVLSAYVVCFLMLAFFIGVGLSIVFLVVHELIHALCCPRDTTVFVYLTSAGIGCVPACGLKKNRYLLVALMPTIVLGVFPFIIWICFPGMDVIISSILFAFSIGSLSMCVGDILSILSSA